MNLLFIMADVIQQCWSFVLVYFDKPQLLLTQRQNNFWHYVEKWRESRVSFIKDAAWHYRNWSVTVLRTQYSQYVHFCGFYFNPTALVQSQEPNISEQLEHPFRRSFMQICLKWEPLLYRDYWEIFLNFLPTPHKPPHDSDPKGIIYIYLQSQ